MRSPRKISLIQASILSLTPAIFAQEIAVDLPTIEVTAQAENPSITSQNLLQAEEQVSITSGGANVVDAEDYKTGRATTLKDALSFSPGVYVQPKFGSEETRISIRGSGIQRTFHGRGIKMLQDGIPTNAADGSFDMQLLDPLTSQYIEVYRGANATRFGSSTLGGAINFVQATGHTAPAFQFRAEAGSFNTYHAQLSTAGVVGNFDYYATITNFYTEGYREHSEQNTQRIFSNFGVRLSENVETRFYLTYVHTDSEIPGNVTWEQLQTHPRRAARSAIHRFDNVDSDWKRDFELFRISNKTSVQLSEDSVLSLSTFYTYKDLEHPILYVIDDISHDLGALIQFDSKADLFGRQNHFTAGLGFHYGHLEDVRFENIQGGRGAMLFHNLQQSTNVDLFLENLHYLSDRFAFSIGGIVSYANRDNQDLFPTSPTNLDNTDAQEFWGYSPKLGFLFDWNEQSQIYFNAARSFEPPSFGELTASNVGGAGLVDLEPQTATTLEIGTRGQTDSGRLKWDFAYYYAWLDDELLELTVAPGLTQTMNAGRTIHQGIELGLDWTVFDGIFSKNSIAPPSVSDSAKNAKNPTPVLIETDKLVLRQHFMWNHFRYDGDHEFGNNALPGIPEFSYRAELLYTHPCGFYAGPNVEWVASYDIDSANTHGTDSYVLLGFKLGFKSKHGYSFFVEGRNLTDERYASTTGVVNRVHAGNSNQYLPGDGRSFFAGFEFKY